MDFGPGRRSLAEHFDNLENINVNSCHNDGYDRNKTCTSHDLI